MDYKKWLRLSVKQRNKKMKSVPYWRNYLKTKGTTKKGYSPGVTVLANLLCKDLEGNDINFNIKQAHKYFYRQHLKVLKAVHGMLKKGENMIKRVRGVVYFITDEKREYIKIGRTTDLKKRLTQLQTGSPIDLILDYHVLSNDVVSTENRFHEKFSKHRKRGEWFIYSDEIKDFIASCRKTEVLKQRILTNFK